MGPLIHSSPKQLHDYADTAPIFGWWNAHVGWGSAGAVVIGAGFTGLEVATELAGRLPELAGSGPRRARVVLVDRSQIVGQQLGDGPDGQRPRACLVGDPDPDTLGGRVPDDVHIRSSVAGEPRSLVYQEVAGALAIVLACSDESSRLRRIGA